MAIKSLADLKAAFKKPERQETNQQPSNYYRFYDMQDGEKASIRFLPDANNENPLGFLVEKVTHTLTINGEFKTVPCLSMYHESCPICAVSQRYYKDGDQEMGKKYWKKKQHIAQILVVEDPLPANEQGEKNTGKVRYIQLNYSLYNIIKTAFEDGELDEIPFAFDGGTDFVIKKSKQGDHASYVLSKFDRRPTSLTPEQVEFVKSQMIDLSTLLPKHPGVERVEAMLEAALSGGEYKDPGKPNVSKMSAPTTGSSMKNVKQAVAAVAETSVEESSSGDKSQEELDADALLEQIKARRAKKAQ